MIQGVAFKTVALALASFCLCGLRSNGTIIVITGQVMNNIWLQFEKKCFLTDFLSNCLKFVVYYSLNILLWCKPVAGIDDENKSLILGTMSTAAGSDRIGA
jgi:hypothetical protein